MGVSIKEINGKKFLLLTGSLKSKEKVRSILLQLNLQDENVVVVQGTEAEVAERLIKQSINDQVSLKQLAEALKTLNFKKTMQDIQSVYPEKTNKRRQYKKSSNNHYS